MSINGFRADGDHFRRAGWPIVEQHAAIRARQRELVAGQDGGSASIASPDGPRSCAIWVRHPGRAWFLSWLLPPDNETAMLNPCPEAAMRFGAPETAAALIERVPALRDKARRDEAGVVDISRPYFGIPLLRSSGEIRLPSRAPALLD